MALKILHTADWHLGKKLEYFARLEEQHEVLEEICMIADAQEVDMVIVAGDLYDAFNPPVEASELLYKTLKRLAKNGTRPVIAIAGNHDSPDRIDSADPLARECGIIFIGYPQAHIPTFQIENGFEIVHSDLGFLELRLTQHDFPVRIISTPYANELRLKQYLGAENRAEELNHLLQQHWQQLADRYCDTQGVNLLTAHLYMLKRGGEILEEPEGERPIKIGNADVVYADAIPAQIQYTALGHLHRYHNIGAPGAPVLYAGSPLCYSFAEAGQQKKVLIMEAQPGQVAQTTQIELQKGRALYRKKFDSIDPAVAWLQAHPRSLVELSIVSDTFLTNAERKRISEAHDGIISLIPLVKQSGLTENPAYQTVNLDQDIYGLFGDYFESKYAQQPNAEITDLFREVLNGSNTP